MVQPTLESLRAEVDEVDARIVDLLALRFRITSEIGRLKAAQSLEPVDREREARQEARFREMAQRNGLNPDLVVNLFRGIIDEVVSNHRKV